MAKAETKKAAGKKAPAKKKTRKLVSDKGKAFVTSSYNNTLVSVTDIEGNVLANSSAGLAGFKGSKKSTAYAATKAGEMAAEKAINNGLREVQIYVKGLGMGRNAAVKGIRSGGLKISNITDITPIPHGGPTPRKAPRGS
jgi:small subunit ribosomal protein S11